MNYYAILKKHYDGKKWGIAEDYSTLDWGDETTKPTDEELQILWNNMEYDYLKEIMRKESNQLLKDCDIVLYQIFQIEKIIFYTDKN